MVSILLLISNLPRLFFQVLMNHSKCTSINWYHRHVHDPQHFLLSVKILVFFYLFTFFYIQLFGSKGKPNRQSLYLSINIRSGLLARNSQSVWVSQSQIILCISLTWTDSGLCNILFCFTFTQVTTFFLLIVVDSCIPFVLVLCIHLLCYQLFHRSHCIFYTCYYL